MAKSKRAAPARAWSPRSQRSIEKQFKLENDIGKFQKLIGFEERKLAEAEVNRTRQTRMVVDGQPIYQRNLEESIAEIEQRKQKIKAFQETIAVLQKEIDRLQPSRSQASERAHMQEEMARLATDRAKEDGQIDAAIKQLQELLDRARGVDRRDG